MGEERDEYLGGEPGRKETSMGRHLGQGRRGSIAHLEDSLVDLLLLFQPLEILVLLLAARRRRPGGFGVWE